jgi:hypothetical protein
MMSVSIGDGIEKVTVRAAACGVKDANPKMQLRNAACLRHDVFMIAFLLSLSCI